MSNEISHPSDHDDFFTAAPNSTINRTQSAWSITHKQPSQSEFSQSRILGHMGDSYVQSLKSEPSSSTTSSYFDDRRPYRPLRTFTPAPYRSPFHTSTISLPDIKEATTEENDSSSTSSMEYDRKDANFHDQNIRKSLEQVV